MARDDNQGPNKRIPPNVDAEPKDLPAEAGVADDGQLEARQLSRGLSPSDLRREAAEAADHARGEKFKDHFEWMALFTVWLLFFAFIAFGFVWVWHMLLPHHGWLTPPQMDKIQGLLTGSVIAGLVADHVRKRMS